MVARDWKWNPTRDTYYCSLCGSEPAEFVTSGVALCRDCKWDGTKVKEEVVVYEDSIEITYSSEDWDA